MKYETFGICQLISYEENDIHMQISTNQFILLITTFHIDLRYAVCLVSSFPLLITNKVIIFG